MASYTVDCHNSAYYHAIIKADLRIYIKDYH